MTYDDDDDYHNQCLQQMIMMIIIIISCSFIKTDLTPIALWNNPLSVPVLLQQWEDALGAAGGGLGS